MRCSIRLAACTAFLASCAPAPAPAQSPLETSLDLELLPFGEPPMPPVMVTPGESDGLVLSELSVRVALDPPFAATELEFAFANSEARQVEGRFEIVLPEGATISRLALQIGQAFQEGEVVERAKATDAYETVLHGRRDPALLERDAGNRYRLRVFPVEGYATKRVIVGYSHLIEARGHGRDASHRVRLTGLRELERLHVEVRRRSANGGVAVRHFDRDRWRPDRDLVASWPDEGGNAAVASGELALLRVTPVRRSRTAPLERFTVLVDTSASAHPDLARRAAELRELLEVMTRVRGAPFDVQIIAFDQEFEPLFEGPSDRLGADLEGRSWWIGTRVRSPPSCWAASSARSRCASKGPSAPTHRSCAASSPGVPIPSSRLQSSSNDSLRVGDERIALRRIDGEAARILEREFARARIAGIEQRASGLRDAEAGVVCAYWENDATDIDLSIYDGMRRHVGGPRERVFPDGPKLRWNVADGFGPECIEARGRELAYPYIVQVKYASRGAMGAAVGGVHVLQIDARGRSTFEMRPFVLMKEAGVADLGAIRL